jgi:hypothetical protein
MKNSSLFFLCIGDKEKTFKNIGPRSVVNEENLIETPNVNLYAKM